MDRLITRLVESRRDHPEVSQLHAQASVCRGEHFPDTSIILGILKPDAELHTPKKPLEGERLAVWILAD